MSDTRITGGCACGAVRFEAAAAPVLQAICHCADCRAATGADFTTTAFFPATALTVSGSVEARAFVAASGAATARERCADCGAWLFDRSEGFPALVGVMAPGEDRRFDPPFAPAPTLHMWVASKAPGVVIDDDLKIFDQGVS